MQNGIVFLSILLIASISLNIWQHFGKLNTTKSELKRIELEAKIEVLNDAIVNYEKHILQLYELKQTPIYHKTIIREKNETILNHYTNANDSTKLYIFTDKLRNDTYFRRGLGIQETN